MSQLENETNSTKDRLQEVQLIVQELVNLCREYRDECLEDKKTKEMAYTFDALGKQMEKEFAIQSDHMPVY
jgi:TnpA family transposase